MRQPIKTGLLNSLIIFIGLFVYTFCSAEQLPNYAREARLANQIVDDLFEGEPVWLNANNHDFLTIHTPKEEAPKGTVIIFHGRGYHPDWPEVAGPLRVGLVEAGWSTLSVQMPVLKKGKKYYDYLPLFSFGHKRIEAAIKYARVQGGDQPIILAAHSCGAHMVNDWLNHNNDQSIDGYIIMGAGATDYGQDLRTAYPFANMQVPILDLYGELEFPRPLAMIPRRSILISEGGNNGSRQKALKNADHYFNEMGEPLTEMVANWLNNTAF